MGKRLFVIFTILLIAGIFTGWYYFVKESKYLGTSPLKAVPVEVPFFVRIRNLGDFAEKTMKNSSWESLRNLREVAEIFKELAFIDSLIRQNKEQENFLRHKELIVVPGDSSKLYLLEIGSISEKKNINLLIQNYFLSKKIVSTERAYKKAMINDYEWDENGATKRLLITFYRGVLMVCTESIDLIRGIEQMDRPSVLEDANFLQVNKNATENIDVNIFVNHKTLPGYLSGINANLSATAIFQSNYAKWTEVDLLQKENQLLINGYTVPDTTLASFLTVFKRQRPLKGSIVDYTPSNTTFFAAQNVSNLKYYLEDFVVYLKSNGQADCYNKRLDSISTILNIDFRQYLKEKWTGEVAAVFTNQNLEDSTDNRFLLIKVKRGSNDQFVTAIKKWSIGNRSNSTDNEYIGALKNNISKSPISDFGNSFGVLYFDALPTKWMTFGDGFILMGATPGSLKRYMNLLQRNDLVSKMPSYPMFTLGLANMSNFYLWSSPGQSLHFFRQVINPKKLPERKNEIAGLKKIENFAWQWNYDNGLVYNTACLTINPKADLDPIPFWSYPLKAKMRNKPVFVSYSGKSIHKDLVFQDNENYLIDLDKDGIERWKIRIEGPIFGEIKMIDYRKNGERQLLFNTPSAIHLIDKNGAEIQNYPVRLKSNATNEMAVIDYDGKKEYRFLIACQDRNVYNFDKFGKIITGWQAKATATIVEHPVRYFRIKTKDYLVFSDRTHTFILDRQGKEIKLNRSLFDSSGKLVFSSATPIQLENEPTKFKLGIEKLTESKSSAGDGTVLLRKDGSTLALDLPSNFAIQAIGSFIETSNVSSVLGYTSDGYLSNFQLILK